MNVATNETIDTNGTATDNDEVFISTPLQWCFVLYNNSTTVHIYVLCDKAFTCTKYDNNVTRLYSLIKVRYVDKYK